MSVQKDKSSSKRPQAKAAKIEGHAQRDASLNCGFANTAPALEQNSQADRLAEINLLKLVLAGESAIDLPRLWLGDERRVADFLRLHTFDLDSGLDMARLNYLHHEAIVYLTDTHRYRLPIQIEQPQSIYDLFLAASSPTLTRPQRFACMTLKVMHILHHISGRELLFNTAISEAQLFEALGARVFEAIDSMRAQGIGILEFAAGKKSTDSLATKLLAKRDNLATHIFDRLRFRICVATKKDLVRTLVFLLRHLVPFNYVLPEQSLNTILEVQDLAKALDLDEALVQRIFISGGDVHAATPYERRGRPNAFSAQSYKTINFVADIPLRIDTVAPYAAPAISFVQTEIQLLDAETMRANERGESAHALYKKRQRARVRARLENQSWDPDPELQGVHGPTNDG